MLYWAIGTVKSIKSDKIAENWVQCYCLKIVTHSGWLVAGAWYGGNDSYGDSKYWKYWCVMSEWYKIQEISKDKN